MLQKKVFQPPGQDGQHRVQLLFTERVFFQIQHIQLMLRKTVLLRHVFRHGDGGTVQVHQPGIIVLGPVHRLRSKPHYKAQHARVRIDVPPPLVGAVAVAHAGGAGHVELSVIGAGDPLHQNGHLLILLLQPSLSAVFQSRRVHGAGIDLTHRVFKGRKPFLRGSPVGAEHRFIFAREGVPEAVLEKAGGTDDDGRLAEILQHGDELLPDVGGECAGKQPFPEFLRPGKISLLCPLRDAKSPQIVCHDIGIEHV